MEMVMAGLTAIRLRFGTKAFFDAFTDEQQLRSGGRSPGC